MIRYLYCADCCLVFPIFWCSILYVLLTLSRLRSIYVMLTLPSLRFRSLFQMYIFIGVFWKNKNFAGHESERTRFPPMINIECLQWLILDQANYLKHHQHIWSLWIIAQILIFVFQFVIGWLLFMSLRNAIRAIL